MAALASDRNTPRRDGDVRSYGVAASQLIYAGAIVCVNAAGYAVKGVTGTNLLGLGRAEERVTNGGSAGDVAIAVRRGAFRFANSGSGDLITAADVGKPAYVVDDQTVAKTDGSATRSIAGFVDGVDDGGVWVRFDEALVRAYLT